MTSNSNRCLYCDTMVVNSDYTIFISYEWQLSVKKRNGDTTYNIIYYVKVYDTYEYDTRYMIHS